MRRAPPALTRQDTLNLWCTRRLWCMIVPWAAPGFVQAVRALFISFCVCLFRGGTWLPCLRWRARDAHRAAVQADNTLRSTLKTLPGAPFCAVLRRGLLIIIFFFTAAFLKGERQHHAGVGQHPVLRRERGAHPVPLPGQAVPRLEGRAGQAQGAQGEVREQAHQVNSHRHSSSTSIFRAVAISISYSCSSGSRPSTSTSSCSASGILCLRVWMWSRSTRMR